MHRGPAFDLCVMNMVVKWAVEYAARKRLSPGQYGVYHKSSARPERHEEAGLDSDSSGRLTTLHEEAGLLPMVT